MSSFQSRLSRRVIVHGIGTAVAAGVASTMSTSVAGEEHSPEIEFRNGCLQVRVEYDPEPDAVTLHMRDGSTHEFTEFGWDTEGDFGYGGYQNDGQVQGWHGPIDRVELQTDSGTVLADADGCSSTDVTCSFFESDIEFTDLRMQYDDAFKEYGRSPSGAAAGSPGRILTRISDNDRALNVDLDGDCEPGSERAVEFDCTSVTLRSEEFTTDYSEFYGAQLHFADGTTEVLREFDEVFEPPETSETYAGSGEHEGKVISRFECGQPGEIYFRYDNPDVDACEPGEGSDGTAEETPEETPTETPEETPTETPEETPTETPEDQPTETPAEETTSTSTPEDTSTGTPTETSTSTAEGASASTSNETDAGGGTTSDQDTGAHFFNGYRAFLRRLFGPI